MVILRRIISWKRHRDLKDLIKYWKLRYREEKKSKNEEIAKLKKFHIKELRALNRQKNSILKKYNKKITALDEQINEYEKSKRDLNTYLMLAQLEDTKQGFVYEEALKSVARANKTSLSRKYIGDQADQYVRKRDRKLKLLR